MKRDDLQDNDQAGERWAEAMLCKITTWSLGRTPVNSVMLCGISDWRRNALQGSP